MKYKISFWITIILLIISVPVLLYTGALLHQNGSIFRIRTWLSDLTRNFKTKNYVNINEDLPVLNLKFKNGDYEKLEKLNLDLIIKYDGILNTLNTDSIYVPVKIISQGKTIKGKARLKGNMPDSRDLFKLSLRFKLEDSTTFMGMSRFSIQHPSVKYYMSEWLFHAFHSFFGFHSPNYFFVNVVINGKNRGILSLEENFDQNYIKRRNLPEGLLIRFDEYWQYYGEELYLSKMLRGNDPYQDDFSAKIWTYSPVDCFESTKVLKDTIHYQQFLMAKNHLESFRNKKIPTHKIFNIDKLVKSFAIGDLYGRDHHYLYIYNVRFFFNPNDSLLEIIGFDNHLNTQESIGLLGEEKQVKSGDDNLFWFRRFFEDSAFFAKYIQELEHISNPLFLDSFKTSIHNDYQKNLAGLKKEFEGFVDNTLDIFSFNQRQISRKLHPGKIAEVFLKEKNKDSVIFEITNIHTLPAVISGIKTEDDKFIKTPPLFLEARQNFKPLKVMRYPVPARFIKDPKKVKIEVHLLGLEQKYYENIRPWPLSENKLITAKNATSEKQKFLETKYFLIDSLNMRLLLKPGILTINQPLTIPNGYTLTVSSGTDINFTGRGCLFSCSPLIFNGCEEQKITIHVNTTSSAGIIVENATGDSRFSYVDFWVGKNIKGNPARGVISFLSSRIQLQNCNFYSDNNTIPLIYGEFSYLDFKDCNFSLSCPKIVVAQFCHLLYNNEISEYNETGEWELSGSFFYNKTPGEKTFCPKINATEHSRIYHPGKKEVNATGFNTKFDSLSFGMNRLSEIAF